MINELPMDSWQTYGADVAAVSEKDVARLVRRHIRAQYMVYVIVGDWDEIADDLRGLDMGEVRLLQRLLFNEY